MANYQLREQVIQLRLQGQTYGQIKRALGVPKATLSNWLCRLPLTEEQLALLSNNKSLSKDRSIEKFRATFASKRLERLKSIYENQKKLIPLTEKELFIAGLFLYWGEGEKRHGSLSLSNTDPRVVKFTLFWMIHGLKISKTRIRVYLQMYQDMNLEETKIYWSNLLNIPLNQFRKPYIKKSNKINMTYKGFGHGTCKLSAPSVEVGETIAMSIKAIAEQYGAESDLFWYN